MNAHQARIEQARLKNLEYIRRLDEERAAQEADHLLSSMVNEFGDGTETATASAGKRKKQIATKNTSVYITGLTTYMACKQLEGMCAKLGKVRRIKFYKDARGGLKGDAVVTFQSHVASDKAIERLNHFEIKPGVLITASAADFTKKHTQSDTDPKPNEDVQTTGPEQQARLFIPEELKEEEAANSATSEGSRSQLQANKSDILHEQHVKMDLPSKSIILKNIWDPLEPQESTNFFDELEEDMRSECSKNGPVEHVHIVANGSVIVRFRALENAIRCLQKMNGRWFAGRQIEASFDQSTPEEPEDEDAKLEAFLASIG